MADAEGSGYFRRGGGNECGKEEMGGILLAIAHAISACLVLCVVCAGLEGVTVRDFLGAVAGGPVIGPDFREGYEIQKLVELAYRSARERAWVQV